MKVYRYEVPVDDQNHEIKLTGTPLYVGLRRNTFVPKIGESYTVEFWAEYDEEEESYTATYRVFGTGHEIDDKWWYVGTAPRDPVYGLVFHLYELITEEDDED